jgi:tetrahydromethanopterin S-methyltransferase subunit H
MMVDSHEPSMPGLLEFQAEQQSFEIAGVRVGGQPGTRATALIGTIFYHGHKVVIDEDRGEFHRDAAEQLIRQVEGLVERTGNPAMLDVVGATPEAICRHLEFVAGVTELPILIDGTTTEVRLAGLQYMAEHGLIDRAVYNSIQPEVGDEELKAVGESGIQNAIILTYYLKDFTAKGRVTSVRELLPRVTEVGLRNLMVDTCVLDLATLGQAYGAMFDIKNQLGLAAGGGVHNAVAMWRGLKSKMGADAYQPCIASAAAGAAAIGADFVLYGPVEDAKNVFPAVAMIDTALSQLMIERGIRPDESHPRFRIG